MDLPVDIDTECLSLVNAMNQVAGIHTVESCCGHEKTEFNIYFVADSLKSLPALLYWFDGCHCGFYGWKVIVKTDCSMKPVHFCAKGPVGKQAYKEAKDIARLLFEANQ